MRHRSIAVLLLVGIFFASAATTVAAGATTHFSSKGLGAEAGWTAVSGSGVNAVYTDTFIFTSRDTFTFEGETFSEPSIFVDQFSYKFDRRGNFVFLSDRIGFASGADVDLSIDSKLRWATVSAVVPFDLCDERSCSPDGISSVVGSWTGTGAIIRVNDNFKVSSQGFTETGHFRGSFRDASASASIDGAGVGDQFFGDIFNSTFRDVFVCHHC